jgi:hypothetical protein
MRIALPLVFLACAGNAFAQEAAHSADSTDVLVVSVFEEDGAFVYDLDGGDESVAYIYSNAGVLVARAADVGTAIVVLEPADGPPGPTTAAVLTPDDPADVVDHKSLGAEAGGTLTSDYRMTVLVCTQGDAQTCGQWTAANPRSGGQGLIIRIVQGPALGPGEGEDPPVDPFDPD